MEDSPTAQYADAPLPERLTVPGWRVGLIVASFSIALPGFLNGAQTGLALGFTRAVICAALAGLILCVTGCATAVLSVRARLTTYMFVQRSFGRAGAGIVNVVMAVMSAGWFGVNIFFFGNAMVAAVAQLYGWHGNFTLFVIAGSALISISTIFGFQTLDRLALVAVPVLGIILVAVAVFTMRAHGVVWQPSATPPVPMSFGIALSALVGSNIMIVATMPDLSRYIRTPRGAIIGMVLAFPLATPLLVVCSALPALATGQTDIMQLVVQLGFGWPVLAGLILSTWLVNSSNLYSAGLSLSATFPRVQPWIFVLIGGAVGGWLCLVGIVDAFVPFLLFLGVITPPIAAIYVIDCLTIFRGVDTADSIRAIPLIHWHAVASWAGSVLLVYAAAWLGLTLTTVPALDATIIAIIIYVLVQKLRRAF
jgi:cytosine permease